MQAKRKLTATLDRVSAAGMLPMTAFAAGCTAAPTNLKLELTETGLKASWDKPETTGGLDIFEYEVTFTDTLTALPEKDKGRDKDGSAGDHLHLYKHRKCRRRYQSYLRGRGKSERGRLRHRRPGQSIGLLCDGVDWLEQFELSIV